MYIDAREVRENYGVSCSNYRERAGGFVPGRRRVPCDRRAVYVRLYAGAKAGSGPGGAVTNRKVGNCGSNLGLEIMRGSIKDGDRFNYITKTSYGKILKSSTIYLTDDNKQPLGALCINLDITNYLNFQKSLESIIAVPENEKIEASTEFHAQDINQLSDFLLQKSLELVKKPVNKLTKDDKITIIRYLDEKGMFLITKSGDKVCQTLNISKFTLYNYLDIIRSEKEDEAD